MSKSDTVFDIPTLVERATSTGSDGCIICSVPTCPTCKKGEECQFTQGTCHTCAIASCVKSESTGGLTNTGGIVGGAVGGVVALALIVGFLLYWFVYRKRRRVALDDLDLMLNDMKWDEESVTTTTGRGSSSDGPGEAAGPGGAAITANPVEKPPMRRHQTYYTAPNRGAMANRRISSYELFTKPQAKRKAAGRPRASHKGSSLKQRLVYLNPSHRNSVATTVSTTNASNILPIAYIPGVTVRPTKNNTRSIYSYEEESIFSDWNTIENASIVGDVVKASNSEKGQGPGGSGRDPTMTAIKAQPRLVPVDRIEEEDEDDVTDEDRDIEYNAAEYVPIHTATAPPTTQTTENSEPSHDPDDTYSSDSDVDSDIGEINRAASLHRIQPREVLMDGHDGEIPIDISELDAPMRMQSANGLGAGSFVLDVEMDMEPYVDRSQPSN